MGTGSGIGMAPFAAKLVGDVSRTPSLSSKATSGRSPPLLGLTFSSFDDRHWDGLAPGRASGGTEHLDIGMLQLHPHGLV